jgi:signal transduction histidine kinase/ligand-binding sensor domain-containing protein
MYKLIQLVLFLCLAVFYELASAQLSSNNLSVYTDMEGAAINDVLADKMGNVWLATGNGLVSFDGYEFTRYFPDPNDSASIGNILTYRLFEDNNEDFWIGCMDFISHYNHETKSFKNYTFAHLTDYPEYSQPAIPAFATGPNGRLYFGVASVLGFNASHSLVYKEEGEDTIRRFEYPDSLDIIDVYRAVADNAGNVWIVAFNGFFRIDPDGLIHKAQWPLGKYPASGQFFLLLKSDNDGSVWITSADARLSKWNPVTGETSSFEMAPVLNNQVAGYYANDMEIDRNGNLWIASNMGLVYFDHHTEHFEILDEGPDEKHDLVNLNCLAFDAFDNLWIGTESNGLFRYSNQAILKSFVHKNDDKNSLTFGWASRVFESSNGSIWLVTEGGLENAGLNELDPLTNSLKPLTYSKIMPGLLWINTCGKMSPDEILFNSNLGHFLFNTNTKTVSKTSLAAELDTLYIYNIFRDSRGNQWYCTTNSIYKKDGVTETLRHFNLEELPGSNSATREVTGVYESKKHGLWVLTNNGLFLYHYNSDSLERIGYEKEKGDILPSQDINSFYEDKEGIAWIGTWGGGLCRYDVEAGKIKTYTIADGLPSMSIQGILADDKNNALWLSTFDGISRFSITEEKFNNFSLEDGIQGRLFADGSCLKTSGGLFVFGGNNGVTVFDPGDIAKNSIPPKVFITGFKIGNTSITDNSGPSESVVLDFSQNNISIDYTGIHYGNPARNKFAYKLENYDEEWREVGNLRTAFYYGLPPGNYKFRVKAANNNGIWNEEGASISIRITPPWWKTWWAYVIYGLLFIAAVFVVDRIQRRRLLYKERALAKEKELEQAREIEKAYHKLKTTQSQLIQAEKMASLGELTAGIAHEIQNPLNFVNNFSDVNLELLNELKDGLGNGYLGEAMAIAEDLSQNEQKINFHGRRASGIVKGMLEHSRTGTGQKEATDINVLADEYLRLAYHGMRAKDNSFQAEFLTEFDDSLPKVEIVPQDIGRVLLNLINNAFYAVNTKNLSGLTTLTGSKDVANSNLTGLQYKPTVIISTKNSGDWVEISVKDNGGGIPEKVLDKVFQPFFTTKPTGQGTGLGLSLSYDIVTKGHNGKINIKTKEGQGSQIIMLLPISSKQ